MGLIHGDLNEVCKSIVGLWCDYFCNVCNEQYCLSAEEKRTFEGFWR
jgi:hypothetical protein